LAPHASHGCDNLFISAWKKAIRCNPASNNSTKRPKYFRQRSILLVEDEERLPGSIKQMLERAGYVVLAAAHGIEALRIVEEQEGRIDIVLTDVGLPRLRGPDLAHD
jgi:PleD family two-component response regulator